MLLMRGLKALRLFLCIVLIGAFAALPARAQNCETGSASAQLDANNVNAGLGNTGALFVTNDFSKYEVPAGSGLTSIFASGLWLGGTVNGELRTSAATYAQFGAGYEFFPGPLGLDGQPPSDCSNFDRVYKVTSNERDAFIRSGGSTTTSNITDWPVGLGAPTLKYDPNASSDEAGAYVPPQISSGAYVPVKGFDPSTQEGEGVAPDASRTLDLSTVQVSGTTIPSEIPDVTGDQTLWWVMNDVGGPHLTTQSEPIGMEVRVTAFAFQTADALNNTTFYNLQLVYRGTPSTSQQPINDLFLGLWADPDLGNPTDDFVGSDSTLGLGYVYNGDANDEVASNGYGTSPPALGYDFFQGPLVNNNGVDDDNDGETDESNERLKMERFIYYNNVNGAANGNPETKQDYFNYLRGRWLDESPIQFGGDGYQEGTRSVDYMFPADPPNFWSEDNVDGTGRGNTPSDRRWLQSSGPFTMEPDETQEIVFGAVWSQTSDRIGSVSKLKTDDLTAQGAFDFNFDLPSPPSRPCLGGEAIDPCEPVGDEEVPGGVAELDNKIVLSWGNRSIDNNFQNSFDQPSAFVEDPNATDTTYTLEGYVIYQYQSLDVAPGNGTPIKTIDVDNDVTTVTDEVIDPQTGAPTTQVVATGSNTGLRNYAVISNNQLLNQPLNNYSEYYFGIQAYAYNAASSPKIQRSPITRVRVVPSSTGPREGGTQVNADAENVVEGQRIEGSGGGVFNVKVTDPTVVTGQDYNLNVVQVQTDNGPQLSYDLVREDGTVLINAQDYYDENGRLPPEGDDIFVEDGLSFTIKQPAPAFLDAREVAGPGGPVPEASVVNAVNASSGTYIGALFNSGVFSSTLAAFAPTDYEIRFTEEGSLAITAFGESDAVMSRVPYEVWDVGLVPPGTENDPSDDVQMMSVLYANSGGQGGCKYAYGETTTFASAFPTTDAIFGYYVAGDSTYSDYASQFEDQVAAGGGCIERPSGATGFLGARSIYGFQFADFTGGQLSAPPTGTVVRIYTTDPFQPNDVYQFSTEEIAPNKSAFADSSEFAQQELDRIGVAPNPYKGASVYDVSTTQDQARFINLPEKATIRVFSLDGRLIKQLEKRNPDEDYLAWDLRTSEGLPIASGIYLIHVKVPGVGETAFKFAVVKKQIQLDVF